MEDVLDTYQQPEDASNPVVCVDETSKQHIKETRQPLPIVEGSPQRYDYEYQRNGVSNLFMIFAPLQGFRQVEVTDRRTSVDFAHICRDLVNIHFPNAQKITLVAIISILIKRLRYIKLLNQKKPDALPKNLSFIGHPSMAVG